MARVISFLFFIAASACVWFDWNNTVEQAKPLRFSDAGVVWYELHPASQEFLHGLLGDGIWGAVFVPVFGVPLAPMLAGLSFVFWLFRRRTRR